MMYKVTIFERYTQPLTAIRLFRLCCYDVQSYNFWKIYTTIYNVIIPCHKLLWCTKLQFLKDIHNNNTSSKPENKLLWCTKLQFLKDIHNQYQQLYSLDAVVMMYKVTIFERYTQRVKTCQTRVVCCYDVQSYNFWKIYTTTGSAGRRRSTLLWCTKLQFLKDIHNMQLKSI